MREIKYVAVRPNGSICGPIGDTAHFVRKSLVIGASRASGKKGITWEEVESMGYAVKKAEIRIIDET